MKFCQAISPQGSWLRLKSYSEPMCGHFAWDAQEEYIHDYFDALKIFDLCFN